MFKAVITLAPLVLIASLLLSGIVAVAIGKYDAFDKSALKKSLEVLFAICAIVYLVMSVTDNPSTNNKNNSESEACYDKQGTYKCE